MVVRVMCRLAGIHVILSASVSVRGVSVCFCEVYCDLLRLYSEVN